MYKKKEMRRHPECHGWWRRDGQCHQELTAVKSRKMLSNCWLRVFSSTLPTAGLVGMPGHFYQRHLSPTLSPIQSNGGEGAMAFWRVIGS